MVRKRSITSQDKSPEEIVYLLSTKGYRCTDVDRKFDLSIKATSKALGYPHLQAERAISTVLQLPAYEIWPSRFDATGKRLKPQPKENYKSQRRFRHCQKRQAA